MGNRGRKSVEHGPWTATWGEGRAVNVTIGGHHWGDGLPN